MNIGSNNTFSKYNGFTPLTQIVLSTLAVNASRRTVAVHSNQFKKLAVILKKYESQKYEKKSPIHENADANITCNFVTVTSAV